MTLPLSSARSLPRDAARATLVGRLWMPDIGPVLVAVHEGGLHDLSRVAATMSQLLEQDDPVGAVRQALRDEMTQRVASLEAALANKYGAMLTPTRDLGKRGMDAVDFYNMVKHSMDEGRQPIDLVTLEGLGEMVWPGGGGKEILRLVEDVMAGKMPNLLS